MSLTTPNVRNQINVEPWYEADLEPDEGRRIGRWLALWCLLIAEYLVLWAYGWRRTDAPRFDEAAWQSPPGHPKHPDKYGRTHAINSLRYYNDPGTRRSAQHTRRRSGRAV